MRVTKQNALRESRGIDDKILYALNNSIPTASFRGQVDAAEKCKGLWENIESVYSRREEAIKKCVSFNQAKMNRLRSEDQREDRSKIRATQTTLRMLSNELLVEEVVRKRTLTAFHEKCRDHFKPPQTSS